MGTDDKMSIKLKHLRVDMIYACEFCKHETLVTLTSQQYDHFEDEARTIIKCNGCQREFKIIVDIGTLHYHDKRARKPPTLVGGGIAHNT